MALNPQLSKASEVLGIRRNDRRHAVDIVCQVVSVSPASSKYKFLTCEVSSDESSTARKRFSLKVWQNELHMAVDVVETDIIRIRKAWKKDVCRRPNNGFILGPHDLDIEFCSHNQMEIEILFSSTLHDVHNFSFLRGPRRGISIRGTVERLPEQENENWIIMLSDGRDVVETHSTQSQDLKAGDFCKVTGNLVREDGLLIMKAETCIKLRTLDGLEETPASEQVASHIGGGTGGTQQTMKAAVEPKENLGAGTGASQKTMEEVAVDPKEPVNAATGAGRGLPQHSSGGEAAGKEKDGGGKNAVESFKNPPAATTSREESPILGNGNGRDPIHAEGKDAQSNKENARKNAVVGKKLSGAPPAPLPTSSRRANRRSQLPSVDSGYDQEEIFDF